MKLGENMQVVILILLIIILVLLIWLIFREHKLSVRITRQSVQRPRLTDNQQKALDYIRRHGKITNDEYQKLAKVGNTKAFEDLQEMEEMGLIEQVGKTGKAVYYKLKE